MQLDRTAHVSVADKKRNHAQTRLLLSLSFIEINLPQCIIYSQDRFCDGCESAVKAKGKGPSGPQICSRCLFKARCKNCCDLNSEKVAPDQAFVCVFCSGNPDATQPDLPTPHSPSSTTIKAKHYVDATEDEKKEAETQAAKMQLNFLFRGLSSLWTKMIEKQVEILVPFSTSAAASVFASSLSTFILCCRTTA
jgi:hypothetical protein